MKEEKKKIGRLTLSLGGMSLRKLSPITGIFWLRVRREILF